MLDAYIIDRIQQERERERERGVIAPLRIESPRHNPEATEERKEEEDRGSTVIDFQL